MIALRTSSWRGVALLCAAALLPAACKESHASEPLHAPPGETWLTGEQEKEAKLTLEAAQTRVLTTSLNLAGKVTLSDLEVAHVFSPVTGRVLSINAQLGQHVQKGQALATIDSPDVGVALADLRKASADMIAAQHNYERQKELADAKAVSQRDFESAQDDYRKAQADFDRAQQMTKILHVENATSSTFTLRAPIAGEILNRFVNPGMEVQGQYGSGGSAVELFTVGDLDPIVVQADVYEMDLANIKVGDMATVSVVAYPERKFQGRIEWLSGGLDPTTRTAKLRVTLQNTDSALHPEMYATVTVAGSGIKALSVPRSAVLHLGDQTMIFKALGDAPDGRKKFVRLPISVNEDIPGDYVQVLHGLDENETIVSSGALLLTNQ